jgi:ABC-type uncharacterized transport system substrate-binding protein
MIARKFHKALTSIAAVTVFALLAGCAGQQQIEKPAPAPAVVEPVVVPTLPPEPEPSRIAILLSDDLPIFAGIAEQITARSPENIYRTIDLDRRAGMPVSVREEIKQFDPDKIVAIGLVAAKAGRQFPDTPMVFCKVFNYQDNGLLSSTTKGVKLLPPFALQLEVWADVFPDLQTAGLIVGPNQDDLVAEIHQAAEKHQIELLVRTVSSDKEALYAFKRLTPKIQGLLLLPDNRVLSPMVLKEIVAYGRKHGNQTAVFNPQLLDLGADISFSSVDADVADAVLKVLGSAKDKRTLIGPAMTSLTTLRVEMNEDVSDYLSAQASATLARYLD